MEDSRKMSKKMLTILIMSGLLVFLPGLSGAQEKLADQSLVTKTLKEYFEVFNKHDVAQVMKFWVSEGEYTAPGGEKIKGIDNIRKRLDSFFRQDSGISVSLLDDPRVMIISSNRAVARGAARINVNDKKFNDVEYTAVFSKDKDGWKILHMQDSPLASFESYQKLSELAWLIGDWIDQEGPDVVETRFQWAPNKSFITGHFRMNLDGKAFFEGNQVIGWDPISRQLKSWVFDSEGGMGQGLWNKDGSGWAVNLTTVLADGRKASAINIYRPQGPDRLVWKSIGREIAGTPLPNIQDTVVVRNPDTKKN